MSICLSENVRKTYISIMISFNDFRKQRVGLAIWQTGSILEGINYHLDVLRLDLLKAAQIPYTITEGQDPKVAEALNWIINYDNERHNGIVETLINQAKNEFYDLLVEDADTDLEAEIGKIDPTLGLKDKIDQAIDRIVDRYQKDIIAQLTGAQATSADNDVGVPPASNGTVTSASPPTSPASAPSSAASSNGMPTPSTPPPLPSTPPPLPSSHPWGDDRWGKDHWFFKKNKPGFWGGLKNLAKTGVRGLGQKLRGAYRWGKDAWNGKYLDHHIIEQVVELMESIYEEVDTDAGMVFEPMKVSLKRFIGQMVNGSAGTPASPTAPAPTPAAGSKTVSPPASKAGVIPTRSPGMPPSPIPTPKAAPATANPTIVPPPVTPPVQSKAVSPVMTPTHHGVPPKVADQAAAVATPPAGPPKVHFYEPTEPAAVAPVVPEAPPEVGSLVTPVAKKAAVKKPPLDPAAVSQLVSGIKVTPVKDAKAFIAGLPKPKRGDNRQTVLNNINDDKWVSMTDLWRAKGLLGEVPIPKSLNAPDQLVLYNKYRELLNKGKLDAYPPIVAPATFEKISELVNKNDQKELFSQLRSMRLSDYSNLQMALEMEPGPKNPEQFANIEKVLSAPKALARLEARTKSENLKSNMASQGAPVTLFNPSQEGPAPTGTEAPVPEKPESTPEQPAQTIASEQPAPEQPAQTTAPANPQYQAAIDDLQKNYLDNILAAGDPDLADVSDYLPKEGEIDPAMHDNDWANAVANAWMDKYIAAHQGQNKDTNALIDKIGAAYDLGKAKTQEPVASVQPKATEVAPERPGVAPAISQERLPETPQEMPPASIGDTQGVPIRKGLPRKKDLAQKIRAGEAPQERVASPKRPHDIEDEGEYTPNTKPHQPQSIPTSESQPIDQQTLDKTVEDLFGNGIQSISLMADKLRSQGIEVDDDDKRLQDAMRRAVEKFRGGGNWRDKLKANTHPGSRPKPQSTSVDQETLDNEVDRLFDNGRGQVTTSNMKAALLKDLGIEADDERVHDAMVKALQKSKDGGKLSGGKSASDTEKLHKKKKHHHHRSHDEDIPDEERDDMESPRRQGWLEPESENESKMESFQEWRARKNSPKHLATASFA